MLPREDAAFLGLWRRSRSKQASCTPCSVATRVISLVTLLRRPPGGEIGGVWGFVYEASEGIVVVHMT